MKRLLFLALGLIHSLSWGQTVLENNPPGLHWYQVRTPHFNILYPFGFDAQAQRVANTLEHIREAESQSLGKVPRRIPIVLQNQSSVSNGFVSVFPRRSEFYTMPTQDYNFIGNNDWLDLLISHEFRHVVQYQHANRGFNRFVLFLFGYPTFSALAHAGAPDWFWEGDAVATETAFTSTGRGKIPYFGLLFRTNLLEGRTFNYHKQYLRSYKHQIPDHYVLGYHMVSYLRRKTNDPDVWEKITARSWNVPFLPFAFSNAIKKTTGLHVTDLYKEMARELRSEWKAQVDTLSLTKFETVNRRPNDAYTDYQFPQPQADGSVIIKKEGIGDIETFCRITPDGREVKIFTPGFTNDAFMLSSGRGRIVWNEYGFDPRWQVRNYSLVKVWDDALKKRVVVSTSRSRHAGAAISPDGQYILTIRTDQSYEHTLVVLRYPSGGTVKEFPNPENHFYSMPRWSDDGKKIVALKTGNDGKRIAIIDFASEKEQEAFDAGEENVGHPVVDGDYLFFNSPITGIDNIHAIDLRNGKRFQVTNSKYGSYNAAISGDKKFIYYNEQTRNGLDVVRAPFDPSSWKIFAGRSQGGVLFKHLIEQEARPTLFDSIPQEAYPVKRYRRLLQPPQPFSWGLFVENDLATVDAGITARDILSTINLTAGYTYDINESTGFWRASLSYQGFYPILDVTATMGDRSVDEGNATTVIISGDDTTRVSNPMVLDWKEENLSLGFRIPLITTSSKYSGALTLQNNVGITRVSDFTNVFKTERIFPTLIRNDTIFQGYQFLEYVGNGTLVYNYLSFSGHRLLKRSHRDIVSRWGQAFNIRYYSTPYGGDFEGGLISAIGYLYLPGLAKHHSLNGYAAIQEHLNTHDLAESGDDYFFRNTVPVPRGMSVGRFKRFFSASANYLLPLWYPDIALGPIVNIQRFRLNVFADYAFGNRSYFAEVDRSYLSVGGELKADLNFMRFLPQFDLGVRYSYGISPSVQKIEVVIGTFNF